MFLIKLIIENKMLNSDRTGSVDLLLFTPTRHTQHHSIFLLCFSVAIFFLLRFLAIPFHRTRSAPAIPRVLNISLHPIAPIRTFQAFRPVHV